MTSQHEDTFGLAPRRRLLESWAAMEGLLMETQINTDTSRKNNSTLATFIGTPHKHLTPKSARIPRSALHSVLSASTESISISAIVQPIVMGLHPEPLSLLNQPLAKSCQFPPLNTPDAPPFLPAPPSTSSLAQIDLCLPSPTPPPAVRKRLLHPEGPRLLPLSSFSPACTDENVDGECGSGQHISGADPSSTAEALQRKLPFEPQSTKQAIWQNKRFT